MNKFIKLINAIVEKLPSPVATPICRLLGKEGEYKATGILLEHIRSNEPVMLHIGSGRNYKDGWINIDSSARVKNDILHDLSKGIPFPDSSVDYIFNEHFIEHLSYEDGLEFMKGSYRALKPGGVIRIACPDLDVLIESYIKDTWRDMEWVKLIKAQWYPSGCFMLNQCIREDGLHQYMYNKSELIRRLIEAGFDPGNISVEKYRRSKNKALENLEKRQDSLIIEAKK
jgi:predicted SAM-dependent methyltransferase